MPDLEAATMEVPADAEKVGLIEFVLSQHSLLGLCFSRSGPAPVVLPTCCCIDGAVGIGDLPIRQRLFMLAFGVIITFFISLEISIGDLNGFTSILLAVVIVLPLVLAVKDRLPRASASFQTSFPAVHTTVFLRVEELCLLLTLLVLTILGIARAGDASVLLRALIMMAQTLAAVWTTELVGLAYTYVFCATCCGCCLPERSEFQNALDPNAPSEQQAPTETEKLV